VTRAIFVWMVLASIAAAPTALHAQDADRALEDREAEARELFSTARDAFDAGDFQRARDLLRRSLELAPRRATGVNLARVLRATGEMLAAEDLIESLLAGHYGPLDAADRPAMETLLEEVRRDVATLTVELRGASRGALRIDGVDVTTLGQNQRHEARLDAGPHVVTVTTEDGRVVEQRVNAQRGEQIAVRLTVPAGRDSASPSEDDEGGGFFSTAWPWIGLAAIAAGAVVVVILLSQPDQDLTEDPVWGSATLPLVRF
jgi:hypothetical protein